MHALADQLHRAGVRRVVCPAAEGPLGALGRHGIEPIVCGDVRLGTRLAAGATRASGGEEIVPVAVDSPAALARSLEAAAGDALPVLVIAVADAAAGAARPPVPLPAGRIERVDGTGDMAASLGRALGAIGGAPAGPAVLEVPAAPTPAAPAIGTADARPAPAYGAAGASARPAGARVRRAARRILGARSPLLVAGAGARRAAAGAALVELAQWAALPVATTPLGRGAFPEAHPLALGTLGRGVSLPAQVAAREADLIVAVGIGAAELEGLAPLGRRRALVAIGTPGHLPDAQEVLIGDPADALEALLACAKEIAGFAPRPTRGLPERLASARAIWLARWRAELTSDARPLSPYRVIHDCQRAIPPREALLVPEAGALQDLLAAFYPAVAQGYLAPGVIEAPGAAIGVALGAKLARPERTCIHFANAASERFLGPGLELAVRCGIPLITAILTAEPEPVLDGAHGAQVETIREPGDIAPAFARARALADGGRPVLLRFVTAPQPAV